jgi:hypothetical protein
MLYRVPNIILLALTVAFILWAGVITFPIIQLSLVSKLVWCSALSAGCVAYVWIVRNVIRREEKKLDAPKRYFDLPGGKYLRTQLLSVNAMAALAWILMISGAFFPKKIRLAVSGFALCIALYVVFTNHKRAIMHRTRRLEQVLRPGPDTRIVVGEPEPEPERPEPEPERPERPEYGSEPGYEDDSSQIPFFAHEHEYPYDPLVIRKA